jgi:hypothetical protein
MAFFAQKKFRRKKNSVELKFLGKAFLGNDIPWKKNSLEKNPWNDIPWKKIFLLGRIA